MVRIPPRQERFVQEYLVDLSAKRAAIRAGYSEKSAETIGSQLLQKTRVQERIRAEIELRASRTHVSQDFVLARLIALASVTISDVAILDAEGLRPKPFESLSREEAWAIESITHRKGSTTIKMRQLIPVLDMLARHLGLYETRTQGKSAEIERAIAVLNEREGRATDL